LVMYSFKGGKGGPGLTRARKKKGNRDQLQHVENHLVKLFSGGARRKIGIREPGTEVKSLKKGTA